MDDGEVLHDAMVVAGVDSTKRTVFLGVLRGGVVGVG